MVSEPKRKRGMLKIRRKEHTAEKAESCIEIDSECGRETEIKSMGVADSGNNKCCARA